MHSPIASTNLRSSAWLAQRRSILFALICLIVTALLTAKASHAQVKFAGTQFSIAGSTLSSPSGVAVDGQGNVYIADRANNRVVSVAPSTNGSGIVSTVLSGLSAPAGVAADWSGNLYIADTGNNRILMLPFVKGALGAAVPIASGFNSPTAIAIDSGNNLYIADSGNNRVVELPRIGNTFGSAVPVITGLNNPSGVAIDGGRNLYIADTGNNRILKEIYTAGTYPSAQTLGKGLTAPMGVAVDSDYNVYIADTGNNRILEEVWFAAARRYSSQNVVGSDVASPVAVARDWDGNVYAADLGNNQVIEVVTGSVNFGALNVATATAMQTYNFNIAAGTVIGSIGIYTNGAIGKDFIDGGGSTCTAQTYDTATACGVNVSFVPAGSGMRTGAIVFYDASGNALVTTYLSGSGLMAQAAFFPGTRTQLGTQLSAPSGVAIDGYGNVYIADTGNNRVLEIPRSGTSYATQITVPVNRLNSPMGLAVDGAGNLYVVSNGNDTVLKLPWTGNGYGPQAKVGANFYGPTGVITDSGGNLFIADTLDQFILRMAWTGSGYLSAKHLGGYVRCPLGVAVDGNNNVYFSMPYQNSIQEIPLTGDQYQQQVKVANTNISQPSAVAVDGNSNLYVLDTGNNRVVMIPWNGTAYGNQLTVADGFNAPTGMALDLDGNIYVADTGNNQVVKIDISSPQPHAFTDTYLGSTSADSAQVVQLENIGNQPLTLSSITYPVDFPRDSSPPNACSQDTPVNIGQSCQLAIDFSPTVTGSPLSNAVQVGLNGNTSALLIEVTGNSLGKAVQSITFPFIADATYGTSAIPLSATASSGLPVTYQVVSGPAKLNRGGTNLSVTGTGAVIVQANQSGSATYNPAPGASITFQILPATLTVTPVNATAIYGSIPATFNYTITGFIPGENARTATTGQPVIQSSAGNLPSAGTYTLTASQGSLIAPNYTFAFAPGTLTVNKASLLVKAVSINSIYGSPLPKFTWTYAGFLNGDGPSVILGAPAIAGAFDAHSPVGIYTITPSLGTLSAANYQFIFASGVATVTPAQLIVMASSQSIVYGQPLAACTYSITGFVAGDTIANATTGAPVVATKALSQSGVGTYAVVAAQGTFRARNYTITYTAGTITISQATLTVLPIDTTMTYGGAVPAFSYSFSGLVGSDTKITAMTGAPSLSTSATSTTRPGTAAIVASLGTLKSNNYIFVFHSGKLTIQKAPLTVQIKSASTIYGSKLPAFSYAFAGFVNGDTVTSISGAPSVSTQATLTSAAGSYPIVATSGTLTSDRYTFSIVGSTLTVAKATLQVAPASATMLYGAALPTFTYKLTGFVNGDSAGAVNGSPTFRTTASSHAHTGTYPLQAALGTLASPNYNFTLNSGTIIITKAQIKVTPTDAAMLYGGIVPAFTYTLQGLLNGDKASSIAGTPVLMTSVKSSSPVGKYAIHASLGSLSSPDYSFAFVDGALTVNKAILTVTPNTASMIYGGEMPKLTYTVSGFINGDTARVVTGTAAVTSSASSTSTVGTYALTADTTALATKNYSFQAKPGTLLVTPALLTVTANSLSIKSGDAIPPLTYAVTGMVNGDTATAAAKGAPVLSTTATKTSAAGSYAITAAKGTMRSTNYSLNFVNGTLTIN